MNLSSIVGLVLGVIFICISILLGGDITRYFDMPSIMIVFGGTISATMVAYSFDNLRVVISKAKDAFVNPAIDIAADIERMIGYANIARREGLLALDGQDFEDPFLQKGIELVVDGTDPELVKDILESEIAKLEESEELAPTVFRTMAQFAPAFGMVGTLIGLINMLMFLEDTSTIGPSMATALITTFYGVILANLIFLPLANKIAASSKSRVNRYEILLEGILSIQNGENPRIIREKLNSLVSDPKALKVPEPEAAPPELVSDPQSE
jgi:chemotaxis protein MotA